MTMRIILAVCIGGFTGYFLFPKEMLFTTDYMLDASLCLLLLFVGIDLGKQKGMVQKVKRLGVSMLVIPIMIAVGSIIGGMIGGMLIQIPANEGGALGAGFGWYTLSSVLLLDYSPKLSALAFLSNVFREVLAIMIIPLIAKYIGYMEAIAPSGATAMDTTLPIITNATDSKTGVLAFISGIFLSMLVPIIVPLFIF